MKKIIGLLLTVFMMTACAKTEEISALKGDKGDPGASPEARQLLFVSSEVDEGIKLDF